MGGEWRQSTWGEEISLEYGKRIRGYKDTKAPYRVYGSNGPVGWTQEPFVDGPGVILGRKGAYRGIEYSPHPFSVIDTAYWVKPKRDLDMRWLYYAIIHYKLGEIDDGSPIPSTTRSAVYVRELLVPPIVEQRAIAHILGMLDDKIELNRKVNRTLEAMAQALFKSWFIDFDPVVVNALRAGNPVPDKFAERAAHYRDNPDALRLPEETLRLFPDRFQDSELGPIPEGWSVQSLDDIATFLNGLACQKYPAAPGEPSLPVIKIRELRQGISGNTDRATTNVPEKYIVHDGDVLFSWSGSLLIDIWTQGKGVLNQHVFKVSSDNYPKWFYFHWVDFHLLEFQRIAADKATTMGHIKRHHLADARVVVPDSDIMKLASVHVSPIFDNKIENAIQARSLAKLRDTLLPKLISGELRVPDVDKLLEDAL